MTKHIWKTHKNKAKNKKFDDVLVNIFNIGNSYFNGYTSRKATAKAIAAELSSVTNN